MLTRVTLVLVLCTACNSHTPVAPAAPTPPAPHPGDTKFAIDVRSMYVDGAAVKYAAEADVKVNGVLGPFDPTTATPAHWKALHEALRAKRDELVKFNGSKQLPTAKLGLFVFPAKQAPDFAATEGESDDDEVALYANVLTGNWRFCFGGHFGRSPNMRKCIYDQDPPSPATYDVNVPPAD